MKRGFIRMVFGEMSDKLKSEILYSAKNDIQKFGLSFTCYTFGEDNHKYLLNNNIQSILINKEKSIYPYERSLKHKLDSLLVATNDFDEFIFIDWDCNLRDKVPDTIFEEMLHKGEMQACLYRWRRVCCPWRKTRESQSLLMNTGFLYIRNKSFPKEAIKIYNDEKLNCRYMKGNDEISLSYLSDVISGGWQDEEYWLNNFEPDYAMQELVPVFPNKPKAIFWHDMKR